MSWEPLFQPHVKTMEIRCGREPGQYWDLTIIVKGPFGSKGTFAIGTVDSADYRDWVDILTEFNAEWIAIRREKNRPASNRELVAANLARVWFGLVPPNEGGIIDTNLAVMAGMTC